MSDSSVSINFGGLLVPLLTLLFVGLKLAEVGVVATWSWWWVLSPIWISLLIWVVVIGGVLGLAYWASK